jgi:hypothetical protein
MLSSPPLLGGAPAPGESPSGVGAPLDVLHEASAKVDKVRMLAETVRRRMRAI